MRYFRSAAHKEPQPANNLGGLTTNCSSLTSKACGDYILPVLDEVALEGLDGIVLEALWLRLKNRNESSIPLERQEAKDFTLQILLARAKLCNDIKFFRLPSPRVPLVIYDRYQYTDPEMGVIVEPDSVPEDPYPFQVVEAAAAAAADQGNPKGSCKDFQLRTDVTSEIITGNVRKVAQLEAYCPAHLLVVVASQELRARSLLGSRHDPLLVETLTSTQWALLERVGRSRKLGEATMGKLSVPSSSISSKTQFYHRKFMLSKGLMTKQVSYQKIAGQPAHCLVLHLPRFYVQWKPNALKLTHRLVIYLKSKPDGLAKNCDVIKDLDTTYKSLKSLSKTPAFRACMRKDVKVPHSYFYPDATASQCRSKNGEGREKTINSYQLIDKDVDPESVWTAGVVASAARDDDVDGDEEDAAAASTADDDTSNWVLNRTQYSTAYKLLYDAGPVGLSQQQLGRALAISKLEARAVYRYLLRRQLAEQHIVDKGRQRVFTLVAKSYKFCNPAADELKAHHQKMEKLTTATTTTATIPVDSSPDDEKTEGGGGGGDTSKEAAEEVKVEMGFASTKWSPLPSLKKASSKQISVRRMKRETAILEAVRSSMVIDDPSKLCNLIREQEQLEDCHEGRMDKKSLNRIVGELSASGQLKIINVKLTLPHKTKELHFVCDPSVDEKHTVIRSIVEQAKMKFNVAPPPSRSSNSKTAMEGEFAEGSVSNSTRALSEMEGGGGGGGNVAAAAAERGGRRQQQVSPQPKFFRMRELHHLLHYLCRGYDGAELDAEAKRELVDRLSAANEDVTADVVQELEGMDIYQKDVGWKMFVPPIPQHKGWAGKGWCLMCDVLLRLPLSLFVTLVNLSAYVDGLESYLNHPIRRHYLVRSLPPAMRSQLLHQRSYIFAVHQVATRLAFIGVLQFGPTTTAKEKDKALVYVNRRASLLDTTTSAKGYHHVEGKEYSIRRYDFGGGGAGGGGITDLERYWYELYEICTYTQLGATVTMIGKKVTVELMDKKRAMLDTLLPKTDSEAAEADNGDIPGDHLGAAGLDSSVFAHVKRNWYWSKRSPPAAAAAKRVVDVNGRNVLVTTTTTKRDSSTLSTTSGGDEPSTKRPKFFSSFPPPPPPKPRNIYTRVLKKRKEAAKPRKPYYDDKDRAALRLMRKLRVEWTEREDSYLLLCKVAGVFLCRRYVKNQMVQYSYVRNLLHKRFPESLNKTSRACQRRINYMLRNSTTTDNVNLFLSDVEQDRKVVAEYDELRMKELSEQQQEAVFERLVDALVQKYRSGGGGGGKEADEDGLNLPIDLQTFRSKFTISFPTSSIGHKVAFGQLETIDQVLESVIRCVIVSSLSTFADKSNLSFHLYKIYQQYPDKLVRSSMNDLRSGKMVSIKKYLNRSKIKSVTANYLPLSSSPYQLSVTFTHKFVTRYHFEVFHQSWTMLKRLLVDKTTGGGDGGGVEIAIDKEGGFAATIVSLMARDRLLFRTEVPQQVIVLDPKLALVDEAYLRILEKYKQLLRASGGMAADEPAAAAAASTTTNKPITVRALLSNSKPETSSNRQPPSTAAATAADEVVTYSAAGDSIVFKGSQPDQNVEERSYMQVAKCASRLALYMMREELREGARDGGGGGGHEKTIQHSHDYFVVSSCRIVVKVGDGCGGGGGGDESVRIGGDRKSLTIPASLLPGNVKSMTSILNRYGLDLYGRSNRAVDCLKETHLNAGKRPPSLADALEALGCSEEEKSDAEAVFRVVRDKNELGATAADLRSLRMRSDRSVADVVQRFLLEANLVVKTGISSVRVIATDKATPWMLHTFKLVRSARESAPDVKFAGKLYDVASAAEGEDDVANEVGVSHKSSMRAPLQSGTKVASALDKVNWDKVQIIDIFLRPWIRVDGTLNRRVLDRMLGSVLGYVMQKPGQPLSGVAKKFAAAVQPYHVRELVELLRDMGCVRLWKLERKGGGGGCRLFEKSPLPSLAEASFLDDDEDVTAHPAVDAIIILGQFIGDKQYSSPDIYECPCHSV